MPFDIEHTGGGGGGRNHRQATPGQCNQMHDLIDAYIETHGLCHDCTTVRMGVGLLSYIALDVASDDQEKIDKDKLAKVMRDLHGELDAWVSFIVASREGK